MEVNAVSNELLAFVLGFIGTVVSAVSVIVTMENDKNRNRLAMTQRCIDKYNAILHGGRIDDEDKLYQFIELVDEELYYMQKRLIVKKLVDEWLSNLINFLPVFCCPDCKCGTMEFRNPVNEKILGIRNKYFSNGSNYNILICHPRIMQAIAIKEKVEPFDVSNSLDEEFKNLKTILEKKKIIVEKMKVNTGIK
jgi:hypothetical protein